MTILSDEQVSQIRRESPTDVLIRERKAADALRKREERKTKKLQKDAQLLRTEAEWWAKNREALTATELFLMEDKDAYCRDLLHSMRIVVNIKEDLELIDIVLDFVKQNPCPHLGYVHIGGLTSSIPPDWPSRFYWQDPQLTALLEAEGKATACRVRYGYLSGLPDWQVVEFLQMAGYTWDMAAAVVGYRVVNGVTGYEAAS
jgi:hypothetical protein